MHIHTCGIFNPNLTSKEHASFNVLKGNIRDFSMKIFFTEDEIFCEHHTYLKVSHVIIKTYICSESRIRSINFMKCELLF